MSAILIEVIDNSGTTLNRRPGAITAVTTVTETRSLDRSGQMTFSCPAASPGVELITPASYFYLYIEGLGKVGSYQYRDSTITVTNNSATLTVTAENMLALYRQRINQLPLSFTDMPIRTVIGSLVAAGFFLPADVYIEDRVTCSFDWVTIFQALDSLRQATGAHFRLKDIASEDQIIEFGNFGDDSGLILQRHFGQIDSGIRGNPYTAIINTLSQTESAAEIWNAIFPAAAGTGDGRFFAGASDGVPTPANHTYPIIYYGANGRAFVFDQESFESYPFRQKPVMFSGIKPNGNSEAEIAAAKRQLYYAAEEYLAEHKDPRKNYRVSTYGLPFIPKVGDLVTLDVNAAAEGASSAYLSINQQFIMTDLTQTWNADGSASADFELSETGLRRNSSVEALASTVSSVEQIKVTPPSSLGWVHVRERDELYNYDNIPERTRRGSARLELDDESVQSVLSVRVTIRTSPFNTHTNVNFATNGYNFVAYNGYNYPQGLRFYLNGVDLTAQLGGPWIALGQNLPYEGEFDITNYINQDPFQSHLIEIGCASSLDLGPVEVPSYPAGSGYTSNGYVEITIRARIVVR